MSVWLTDLADVARSTGLPVTEVDGWQTRGHGGMTAVRGIVCHHTAGPRDGDFPSLAVVRDGRPGLDGPLSALGLGRSGTVYVIAAGLSWHAGEGHYDGLSGNSDCIGIEAESVGDGTDWTAAQRDAYPRLCAALCRAYKIPASLVIAHREWTDRKIDPLGIDMPTLRADIARLLDQHEGQGGDHDPIGDDMTPEQERVLMEVRDGIRWLQEALGSTAGWPAGTPEDGRNIRASIRWANDLGGQARTALARVAKATGVDLSDLPAPWQQ